MRQHLLDHALTALAICLLLAGCGDGAPSSTGISGSPTYPTAINGTYSATSLALTQASGTTDMLAAGAAVSLVLTPGGKTTGSMTVPAAYSESGEEEILSLNGTYTYDAATGVATLSHAADTFLRDATWQAKGTKLTGTFDGGTYTLTVVLDSGS